MYAFAQRSDTQVYDEPLYAHYLLYQRSTAAHPLREQVIASMENDGQRVVEELLLGSTAAPVLLFKQMTHHLLELDWTFMERMQNVLLIRDPARIIHSYSRVVQDVAMEDVGIQKQFQLYQYLRKKRALSAIVDAHELLMDPRKVLQQLCQALLIPFEESMLSWPPGSRPEDGVWATYWYANVHRSSGFQAYQPGEIRLEGSLKQLADACRPYYEALYGEAIRAVPDAKPFNPKG